MLAGVLVKPSETDETRRLALSFFALLLLSAPARGRRIPLAFGIGEAEDSRMTPRAHKGTTAGARRAASAIQGDSANGVSVPELIDRETGVREIIEILEG